MNYTLAKIEELDPQSFSFGAFMTLATKMDTLLDKLLKEYDLT